MEQYHGTSKTSGEQILKNKIDVNKGGGELGKGFYVGDLVHEAYNWAWHKYKKENVVVKIDINDEDFIFLEPLCLNNEQTGYYRNKIRREDQTRSYIFNENAIWAPVVGKKINYFNQVKYESKDAESFLNSNKPNKTIL